MCKQFELINWNKFEKDLENITFLQKSVDEDSNLYKSVDEVKALIDLIKSELGLKKWSYSVSTNVIWSSFDYGEVIAKNYEDAKKFAKIKLDEDFKKANELLGNFGSINYGEDEITIEEIR